MIIHFINLNNFLEKNYIAQKCLESWQKNMPNAEIKIWIENDEFMKKILSKNSKFLEYFQQKNKNYGHLCDYLRIHLQYEFGGIYSELDQMLLKPLEIDEDTEFCHSLIYTDCVTTTSFPSYFKKGNKLLKYLIDILDNDFDAKWMTRKQTVLECGNTEWSFCLLRNLSEDLIKIKNELRINSKKFFKKEWHWCLHFADWQLECCQNIILIDEQLYQEESENLFSDAFFFVFGNIKDFKIDFFHHKIIDYKLKPLFLKFIKYQIYKSPKIKDKIIDVQNCLGNTSEITEKDFEINVDTFFKY